MEKSQPYFCKKLLYFHTLTVSFEPQTFKPRLNGTSVLTWFMTEHVLQWLNTLQVLPSLQSLPCMKGIHCIFQKCKCIQVQEYLEMYFYVTLHLLAFLTLIMFYVYGGNKSRGFYLFLATDWKSDNDILYCSAFPFYLTCSCGFRKFLTKSFSKILFLNSYLLIFPITWHLQFWLGKKGKRDDGN